jgi:hypothetical protein
MKFLKVKSYKAFVPQFLVPGHKILGMATLKKVMFLGITIRKYLIFQYVEKVIYTPRPLRIVLDEIGQCNFHDQPLYTTANVIKTQYIKL